MVRCIIPKILKLKVLRTWTGNFRCMTARTNHYATKRTSCWFALVSDIEKVHESTLRTFLKSLKNGLAYSFLFVAFFVSVSTPSLFKDDWTSVNLWQECFCNCSVYLSFSADWSQTLWRALFLSCLRSPAKQNKQIICCLIWYQEHCKYFFAVRKKLLVKRKMLLVHLTVWW